MQSPHQKKAGSEGEPTSGQALEYLTKVSHPDPTGNSYCLTGRQPTGLVTTELLRLAGARGQDGWVPNRPAVRCRDEPHRRPC